MGWVQSTWLLVIGLSCSFPSTAQGSPSLRVFVYATTVGRDTVASAETESSHILERAGVRLIWRNCAYDDPCKVVPTSSDVVLRIIKETGKDALGCSFVSQGGGAVAFVGFRNIERLADSSRIAKPQILAAVIAHEIGHLLLGPAHTRAGIMHGNWDVHDLCRLEQRQLKFDPDQCRRINAAVTARSQPEHVLLAAGIP